MRGYTLQCSNSWWPSNRLKPNDFIGRMTHSGDTYVDVEAFIKHVNEFLNKNFEECYEDSDKEEKETYIQQYGITEEILNSIKVGDYYLLFHGEEPEMNWVVRCHNVI